MPNPLTHLGVAAALGATARRDDATPADRARLAGQQALLRLAATGERDPEKLRAASRAARREQAESEPFALPDGSILLEHIDGFDDDALYALAEILPSDEEPAFIRPGGPEDEEYAVIDFDYGPVTFRVVRDYVEGEIADREAD